VYCSDDFFECFCKVLKKDHFVRFVAISNHVGRLLANAYRDSLVPLMTSEETACYAMQAAIRAVTRDAFESKIGALQFSISRYARLVRATVPIRSSGKSRFLLLSLDADAETDSIINKNILTYVAQNRDYFL
jgi:hypothetical protein